MIKILHCADLHLGDLNGPIKDGKNARREDTLRCMKVIARMAQIERPNVSIIAGDLFNRSRVWADTALEDIEDAINSFLRPICRASEQVVLLFGTMNHDNPRAFSVLAQITQGERNLHIYTGPTTETLNTSAGEIQILAMPGFDKGRLRAFMPDIDAETENQNATTLVNEIIMGQAARLKKGKPSVLVAHYTVAGCEADNGQTFLAGQDVVILPQTIDAIGVTLGCFGHIHKPQRLGCNTPTYYCGSPNQLTFNDEHDKHGFYIHEISEAGDVESRFLPTPERRHLTVRLTQEQVAEFIANNSIDGISPQVEGAILRVYYNVTAEQEKALNRAALQSWLIGKGAFHVADFIREDMENILVQDGAAADDTPAVALHRYLSTMQDGGAELTDADIRRMEELAAPIIREADDGREANQHTGAFIPKRIEVTNYRSYTHADFSFEEIRMAMVNGQNGVGKSSLFMDAIADCLYENSRDGAIGEWLREGEKKGAIIFEFEIGGADYRVSRTRNQSGRGTLALARLNPDTGEWENAGDTTMKLTQEKIMKTVGMDCQTFCSIALIRQDAYGLFLEADSDRRMEVLSSLLNLGVYARAEELSKDKASEQRRKISALNDRMGVLEGQMAERENTERELKELIAEKALKAAQAKTLEAQIQAVEREETLRQEFIRQAQEKVQEAAKLDTQAQEKEDELLKQKTERNHASSLARMAGIASEAAKAIEQARADLEPLVADETQLHTLTERQTVLQESVQKARDELERLNTAKQTQQTMLSKKDEIEAAVREMEQVRTERQALAPRIMEYDSVLQTIADLKQKQAANIADSRVRIGQLKNQIATAEQKAQLLADSGCPMADSAACAFLKDAQAAKAELANLTPKLDAMKAADRKTHERLTREITIAQTRLDGMGNPKAELDMLAEREQKVAPIAAQAGKLEAAAATIKQMEKQEADKAEALAEMEAELQEITKKLPPLQQSAQRAAQLRGHIKANEPTAALQSQCAAAVATVKALDVSIEMMSRDAEEIRQKVIVAQQEAETMKARIPEATGDAIALRESRESIMKGIEQIATRIGGLQTKLNSIAEAQGQWETYRDEKNQASKALNDYNTLTTAFGLDGIQYVIIRSIVPEIMDRANAILSAMTGGRMAVDFRTERETKNGKKIVNSLDVWITSLNGGCRPYSSHSGGEKVKIALAVTLGLADVKARRAGIQLGMLFIDEPPFLDADGTDAYADALTSMANRNPEMRILAISHDPQLKARFTQNITVTAGENGSKVAMT